MRFSTIVLALIPATFAAPIPDPRLLDLVGKIPIIGAVTDSIRRPELLASRLQVVRGLSQTKSALQSIIDETAGGDNAAVATTAETALDGINKAQGAVNTIGRAILTGQTPQQSDQATVAQGLVEAKESISVLTSQVVTPSDILTDDINDATEGVALAIKGGEGVLAASDLSFADVGVEEPEVRTVVPAPAPTSTLEPSQ